MALSHNARGRGRRSRRNKVHSLYVTEVDYTPPTPHDERVNLPVEERAVRREVLPDGTVSLTFTDPPRKAPAPTEWSAEDWLEDAGVDEADEGLVAGIVREHDRKEGLR